MRVTPLVGTGEREGGGRELESYFFDALKYRLPV